VRQHQEAAFRLAYLIVREQAEAQDVTQDAFVRAYKSLGLFNTARPFRPWLLRIVKNTALNNRRSAKRRVAAHDRLERQTVLGVAPHASAAAEAIDEAARLWAAVATLREEEQAVIYLRYYLDASEAETATAMGCAAGTVKSRLHRALRRLREKIGEEHLGVPQAVSADARSKA
jgi:RNA polymerase sigma-70 factor (ECF subfamily)